MVADGQDRAQRAVADVTSVPAPSPFVAIPTQMLDLLEQPWAIRLSVLRMALSWVELGAIPTTALAPETRPAQARRAAATAVIPVMGPITRYATPMSFLCGGASTEEISAALTEALSDPDVADIVLQIDSPGGTTDGIPELAAEIRAARERKPITARVDTVAASAAYWLASQASRVEVTPSGSVGSIGVFGVHMDRSQQMAMAGVKPTIIAAGRYKTEANPYEPLSDEARAEIQRSVDAFAEMFIADVAAGRGTTAERVRAEFGEGRMVRARDAVTRGMADAVMPLAGTSGTTASLTQASLDQRVLLAVAHANASRIQRAVR